MKTLVIYYTRTNTTKKVAENIADKLSAEIFEVKDKKDWKGPLGYMNAGRYALNKKLTEIEDFSIDVGEYDLVLIGTPVWVGTMSVAIRTFLESEKGKLKSVAFFSTQGSSKRQRVFDDLENMIGKKGKAELILTTKEVNKGEFEEKVMEFVNKLV